MHISRLSGQAYESELYPLHRSLNFGHKRTALLCRIVSRKKQKVVIDAWNKLDPLEYLFSRLLSRKAD